MKHFSDCSMSDGVAEAIANALLKKARASLNEDSYNKGHEAVKNGWITRPLTNKEITKYYKGNPAIYADDGFDVESFALGMNEALGS